MNCGYLLVMDRRRAESDAEREAEVVDWVGWDNSGIRLFSLVLPRGLSEKKLDEGDMGYL